MKKQFKFSLWVLLGCLLSGLGYASTPPRTGVVTDSGRPLNHITTETNITIGVAASMSPCLSYLDTDPVFYHLSANNHITYVFPAFIYMPCTNIPVLLPFYTIGQLPAGDYTMQVYTVNYVSQLPGNINDPLGAPVGELVRFTVYAHSIPVPAMGLWSTLSVIIGVLLSLFWLRKKRLWITTGLLLFCGSLSAKEFIILLSNQPGAPTPEQVVNQAVIAPPPPSYLLSSFNSYTPNTVTYLLSEQPLGQRLDLINNNPNWLLSKLYRYLIVSYADSVSDADLSAAFAADPHVEGMFDLRHLEVVTAADKAVKPNTPLRSFVGNFLNDLDINMAWQLSEGMGYIGIMDTGIDLSHNAFKAFSDTGQYLGGNLLEAYYQIDLGSGDMNIDEREPKTVPVGSQCDLADGVADGLASSIFAGHGTHVSGIIAAKDPQVQGICKNCGLGVIKYTRYGYCVNYNGVHTLDVVINSTIIAKTLSVFAHSGYNTVNWSGGTRNTHLPPPLQNNENFCLDPRHQPVCEALEYLKNNQVMMVSSAGNKRNRLMFPGSEIGTVAVGGLDQSGIFWNESPGPGGVFDFSDASRCPPYNECGSNIGNPVAGQTIDVMAQAKRVYSTFYHGGRWSEPLGCSDNTDGVDDGYGHCTGTSMSSPQVASIVQLIRSAHPLLPNGTYDPSLNDGVINVLNSSGSRYVNGLPHSHYLGYGLPSASLAVARVLGYSNGQLMKTRLTPMFELYSDTANNNVYTPFPQVAKAFLTANGAGYTSTPTVPDFSLAGGTAAVPLVSEFTEYWHGSGLSGLPSPRAYFYVFSTNNNPFTGVKDLLPLRRMEKTVGSNRNDTYATTTADIERFHADGYNYAGIEGYVLPPCSPLPGCAPSEWAERLYRDESDSMNHRLFAVHNSATTPALPATFKFLGFVFRNIDSDGDGLINGQEVILGTNIANSDSDGDGLGDGVEYPAAGVPVSDPVISDIIFANGFELPIPPNV